MCYFQSQISNPCFQVLDDKTSMLSASPFSNMKKIEKKRQRKDVKNLFRIKRETAKENKQNTTELEMYAIFFDQEKKQPKK